jgi:hypothetical protein
MESPVKKSIKPAYGDALASGVSDISRCDSSANAIHDPSHLFPSFVSRIRLSIALMIHPQRPLITAQERLCFPDAH